jgi:hypothetical protein
MKKKSLLLIPCLLLSSCAFRGYTVTKAIYDNDFYCFSAADQWIDDDPSKTPASYTNYLALYIASSHYYFKFDGSVTEITIYKQDSTTGAPILPTETSQGTYECANAGATIYITFPTRSVALEWKKWYMTGEIRVFDFPNSPSTTVYMMYVPTIREY